MFTYYYRIPDKYRMPVTAFAIFTDASETFHPAGYENSFLGTSILFEFNTYKVLNQDENNLKNSNNPFAMAVLTVLITLKSKKSGDEKLFELKHSLLRNLIRGKIPPEKIDGLMTFLRLYLRFENPDYIKFEEVIEQLNEHRQTMGINEFVLERAKKEGLIEGRLEITRSLITQTDFTDEKIAGLVDASPEFVRNVRKKIKAGSAS